MSELSIVEGITQTRLSRSVMAFMMGAAVILPLAACSDEGDYVSTDYKQIDEGFAKERQEVHRRDVLGREADATKKQADQPTVQGVAIGNTPADWGRTIAGNALSGLRKTSNGRFKYHSDTKSWDWNNGSGGDVILRAGYESDTVYGDRLTIYERGIVSEAGRRVILSCNASFQGLPGLTKAPKTGASKVWYGWLRNSGREQLLPRAIDCTKVPLDESGNRIVGDTETGGLTVRYDDAKKGYRPPVSSYALRDVPTGSKNGVAFAVDFLKRVSTDLATVS